MAKHGYYSRNKKYKGRRLFLLVAFGVIIAAVIWKIGFHVFAPGINKDAVGEVIQTSEQADDPEITVPEQINETSTESEESVQMTAAESANETDLSETVTREAVNETSDEAQVLFQAGLAAFESKDYIAAR